MQIRMRARVYCNLALVLAIAAFSLAGPAEEKPTEKKVYPLWDGKESVADYAKRVKLDPAITLDLGDGVKMEFVLIPAGKFKMGSPKDEENRQADEGPQHDVTIGNPFYMGKFEVTQEQYEKITKSNPSLFEGARNPVGMVSWDDAQAYCKQMSQKTGRSVRLPSEAEWEYACRAGSTTPFHLPKISDPTDEQRRKTAELIPSLSSDEYAVREKATRDLIALGSDVLPLLDKVKTNDAEVQSRLGVVKSAILPKPDLKRVAWFYGNSNEKTHPVGEKEPNAFNLHDMHGNVWEWVEDDWHDNYTGAPADESAWVETPRGGGRVLRGGSWHYFPWFCRSAYRGRGIPEYQDGDVGFRVVWLSSSPRAP
jgi:formylglycine-generating enzyme required for sulfatase activity